jgi:hypothetical protein
MGGFVSLSPTSFSFALRDWGVDLNMEFVLVVYSIFCWSAALGCFSFLLLFPFCELRSGVGGLYTGLLIESGFFFLLFSCALSN